MESTDKSKIYEALQEVVKDKFLKFLQRFCHCVKFEIQYEDILKLERHLKDLENAIINKQELDLEVIKLRVKRKFLTKTICVEYKGEEYCDDKVNLFLSKVRTIIDLYRNDCDLNYIIAETIENNDFNLIDFTYTNLDSIRRLCRGEQVQLDMSKLEDFARIGIENAIKEYLDHVRRYEERSLEA